MLGEKGTIFIQGNNFEVNRIGEVYQDGEFVDRLLVYKIEDRKQLEKIGSNYFDYVGPDDGKQLVDLPEVSQGYLEASNVNAIRNLTNMILAHRSYEAYQKAIKNFDTMMDKSSNSLGQLRG